MRRRPKISPQHAELIAWANGLRPDSPRFHEHEEKEDSKGEIQHVDALGDMCICLDCVEDRQWIANHAVPRLCRTCNGRGEIGGFVGAESGYQTDPCPDCTVGGGPAVTETASLEK